MANHRYEGLGFTYLLNVDANAKTVKGQAKGYMTAILYLAPHKISGTDVCPYATQGCKKGCLYTAGHGRYDSVKKARIARTKYLIDDREGFMVALEDEIRKASMKAEKKGLELVVRLNGTSDIDWNFYYRGPNKYWNVTIFTRFPAIQYYDYTKDVRKMKRNRIPNYHLTYSYHENSDKDFCYDVLHELKGNIAVVMDKKSYQNAIKNGAIDGDAHDLRFLDAPSKIVALTAKGEARKDTTGFVVRNIMDTTNMEVEQLV